MLRGIAVQVADMIVEGFALDSDTARVVLARVLANYAATIRWGCVLAAPLRSRGMAWHGMGWLVRGFA